MVVHFEVQASLRRTKFIAATDEVFEHGQYADKVIQRTSYKRKEGGAAQDRKIFFCWKRLYGIVRWERLVGYLADRQCILGIWGAYCDSSMGN